MTRRHGRAGYNGRVADKLKRYRAKRDFEATPEPRPAKACEAGARIAPRFVVQEHSATRLHWDLRLEHDGALASWALPRFFPNSPGDNRLAVRTEDHPLEYLTFDGEIPKGEYGAGTMSVYDTRHLRRPQVGAAQGRGRVPRRAAARAATRCSRSPGRARPRARTG